ncbi:MAG: YbhN family protein [Hyphomonadaceae bacterium]
MGDESTDELAPAQRRARFKLPRWASMLVAVAFLAGAFYVIRSELAHNSPQEMFAALRSIPVSIVLATLGLTALSFACLIVCEWIALSMLGHGDIPLRRVWRPAFTAYALGNAMGLTYATVPAARARLYKDDLTAVEIAKLSALTGAAVLIGGAGIAGLGILFAAEEIAGRTFGTVHLWWLAGLGLLAPMIAWLATAAGVRPAQRLFGLRLPRRRFAVAQVLVGMLDWACAAAVLYLLLPTHAGWSYPAFVAVFLAAGVVGAVSGAPAGIGVFEATILALSANTQYAPAMAAGLIAYRLIWTVAPLTVGALMMGYDMLRGKRRAASRNP